jgi:hypothetical protein
MKVTVRAVSRDLDPTPQASFRRDPGSDPDDPIGFYENDAGILERAAEPLQGLFSRLSRPGLEFGDRAARDPGADSQILLRYLDEGAPCSKLPSARYGRLIHALTIPWPNGTNCPV